MKRRALRSVGLILMITLAAAPTLRGQTSPKRTPEQIQASYAAHKGEFDYLLGDWEFTATSQQYGKFQGLWSAVRLDKRSHHREAESRSGAKAVRRRS